MPQVRTRIRRPAPVSDALQQVGDRIRKARTEAGLSQAQLGSPHFTRAYVSAIELGKVRPAMKSLEFMAAKLNKPVAFFVVDDADELRRKEREVEIAAAASLLSRQTAADSLARTEALIETAIERSEIADLRLMAGTALNFLIKGPEAVKQLSQAARLATEMKNQPLHRRIRYQLALA